MAAPWQTATAWQTADPWQTATTVYHGTGLRWPVVATALYLVPKDCC